MGKKKQGASHSQINGIVWITVVLITILTIVFFSRKDAPLTVVNDSIYTQKVADLEKKEDSAYRSRNREMRYRKKSMHEKRKSETGNHTIGNRETSTFHSPSPTRQPLKVELNSADTTTLMLLHGIGPTFAKRIVKYRNHLGGFTTSRQLLEVYGFTPELFNHIAPYLLLDSTNIRKININSVELKQFIKHPYVEYYFARDIVNLRAKGVTFSSPEDLRAIPSCTDTMLTRLLPYLEF